MRWWGQFNFDAIVDCHFAADQHDAHDTGLADQSAAAVAAEDCLHQARLKAIQLEARIAQPRYFYDRRGA